MNKVVTFIPNAGGSIVSKNILSHKGKLRWCVREESVMMSIMVGDFFLILTQRSI